MMKKIFPAAQTLLRFALGAGFILPVLDRTGFLGAPGSPNVSWGNWANFVAYANKSCLAIASVIWSITWNHPKFVK